jgi:hypothetical protein
MNLIDTTRGWHSLMVGPRHVGYFSPDDTSASAWNIADSTLFQALTDAACPLLETDFPAYDGLMADVAVQDGHVVAHDRNGAHVMDATPCAGLVLAWFDKHGLEWRAM